MSGWYIMPSTIAHLDVYVFANRLAGYIVLGLVVALGLAIWARSRKTAPVLVGLGALLSALMSSVLFQMYRVWLNARGVIWEDELGGLNGAWIDSRELYTSTWSVLLTTFALIAALSLSGVIYGLVLSRQNKAKGWVSMAGPALVAASCQAVQLPCAVFVKVAADTPLATPNWLALLFTAVFMLVALKRFASYLWYRREQRNWVARARAMQAV